MSTGAAQFNGQQYARTGTYTDLLGATAFSMWVELCPQANAGSGNGDFLLGKTASKCVYAQEQGTSTSGVTTVNFKVQNGSTTFTTVNTGNLTVGTWYGVLLTFDGTNLYLYVNGANATPTALGAASVYNDSTARDWQVGASNSGATSNFLIEQWTVWTGVTLTQQNARDLRDQKITPMDASLSTGRLFSLPLTGTAALALAASQTGTTDATSSGRNLTTFSGGAAYTSQNFQYVAGASLKAASVCPSGKQIVLSYQDASGNPTVVTNSVNSITGITYAINGGAAQTPTGQTVVWSNYEPYIHVPLNSADYQTTNANNFTISYAEGTIACASGTPVGLTNYAIGNATGGTTLPAFPTGAQTMLWGENSNFVTASSPVRTFMDRCKELEPYLVGGNPGGTDANGYPNDGNTPSLIFAGANLGSTLTYQGEYTGPFDLYWKGGPQSLSFTAGGGTAISNGTPGTYNVWNHLTGTISLTSGYSVAGNVVWGSPALSGGQYVNAIHLYPPSADRTKRFAPDIVRQMQGIRLWRSMTWLGIPSSCVRDPSDLATENFLSYYPNSQYASRTCNLTNATVSNWNNQVGGATPPSTDLSFQATGNRLYMLITLGVVGGVQQTHSFGSDEVITFSGTGAAVPYTGTASGTYSLDGSTHSILVINNTSFAIDASLGTTGTYTATTTSLTAGTAASSIQPGVPYNVAAAFAAQFDGCHHWTNIGHNMSDAAIQAAAQQCFSAWTTDPSRLHLVEYSDEMAWNYGTAFQESRKAYRLGNSVAATWGTNPDANVMKNTPSQYYNNAIRGYVKESKRTFDVFVSGWVAAGGSASQCKWVIGSEWVAPSTTQTILNYCQLAGLKPDYIAVAPYINYFPLGYNNGKPAAIYGSLFDTYTPLHLVDHLEAYLLYGCDSQSLYSGLGNTSANPGHPYYIAQFNAATGGGTQLVTYEGGLQQDALSATANTAQLSSQIAATKNGRLASYHPNTYYAVGYILNAFAQAQCAAFCHFSGYGTDGKQTLKADACWPTWRGLQQVAGTGDGTDHQYNNLADIIAGNENYNLFVSVQAKANAAWNALLPAAPSNAIPDVVADPLAAPAAAHFCLVGFGGGGIIVFS